MPGTRLADFRRKRNRGGSRKLFFFFFWNPLLSWIGRSLSHGLEEGPNWSALERLFTVTGLRRWCPRSPRLQTLAAGPERDVEEYRGTGRPRGHANTQGMELVVSQCAFTVSTARSTPGLLSLRHPQRHPLVAQTPTTPPSCLGADPKRSGMGNEKRCPAAGPEGSQ